MKKLIITLIIAVTLLSPISSAFALPADGVEVLNEKDYYPKVHQTLENARESIYFVMYGIQMIESKLNPVYILVQDLIAAHKRGVKVEVVLEQSSAQRGDFISESNKKIAKLLAKEGIEVRLDNPERITHVKLIVVDNYYTILGSHNWTYTALTMNNESSVLIRSKAVAQEFIKYFYTVR